MALSPQDQAKWDRLQDASSQAIDAILAGRASDSDLRALSNLLAQQHALAGALFDQGVEDAKATADTIVDRLNAERISNGKRPLSQRAFDRVFESTMRQVMSQSISDVMIQIRENFEAQAQANSTRVDDAIERLRNARQQRQQPPTPPGEVGPPPADESLHDRFIRENGRPPDSGTPRRRSLMDRIMGDRQADGSRTTVLQAIKEGITSAKEKLGGLYERFTHRRSTDEEERSAAIWMRKLKAVFNPVRNAYGKAKAGASKLGDWLAMIGKPLMLALMNPQLIQTITDSVSQYLNFDKISGYVSSMWEDTKKVGTDSIDWVIDKVKSFFGFGKNSKPTPAGEVKRAAPAKQTTATGELPKSITSKDAELKLPSTTQALTSAKAVLAAAENKYAASPTAANKKAVDDARRNVTFWQTRVTQYSNRANEGKTAGSDMSQVASLTPPVTSVSGSDIPRTTGTAQAADPAAVLGGSSVAPMTKTEIIGDLPKYTPGKAYDAPETREAVQAADSRSNPAVAQIGLGSFGYDNGDPTLNILNLGMLG